MVGRQVDDICVRSSSEGFASLIVTRVPCL